MEKYSLVCTANPSFLCFLSLSFGEGKVMVGIVDAFDKKGYDDGSLVSTVCCMPLINVPYKCTFGVPYQGQMLDV
jgi:hypothetical protein